MSNCHVWLDFPSLRRPFHWFFTQILLKENKHVQITTVSDISSVILWFSGVITDTASYRRWNLVFVFGKDWEFPSSNQLSQVLCLSRRWQEPARIVVHDSHLDGNVTPSLGQSWWLGSLPFCKMENHKFWEVNHHFMIYFYGPCPIAMLNKRRGIVDTVVGLFSNKCFGALPLHRSCLVRFDGQWLYMLWVLIMIDFFHLECHVMTNNYFSSFSQHNGESVGSRWSVVGITWDVTGFNRKAWFI